MESVDVEDKQLDVDSQADRKLRIAICRSADFDFCYNISMALASQINIPLGGYFWFFLSGGVQD